MMHWTSLYRSSCTGSCPLLVTSGGRDWISVQTCSFKDLTVQGSSPRPVISGGCLHAVIKQTVGILLECFLVFKLFTHFIHCSFMYLEPFQLMLIVSVAFEHCACGLISYLDSFSSLFLNRVFRHEPYSVRSDNVV